MKRVILCEGKTDAILISYFLEKQFDWIYTPDHPIKLPVGNARNEELKWYRHADRAGLEQELVIWGVGGISQIPVKFQQIIDNNQRSPRTEDRFEYIVLFFDHDEPTDVCLAMVRQWIEDAGVRPLEEVQLSQWLNIEMNLIRDTPPGQYQSKLLAIVLPPDGRGALETFLIGCWKQFSEPDKQLAEAAETFIDGLPTLPKRTYLSHRRLPDKACLGTILSVFSPDGSFEKIYPKLKSLPWEQVQDALTVYGELGKL